MGLCDWPHKRRPWKPFSGHHCQGPPAGQLFCVVVPGVAWGPQTPLRGGLDRKKGASRDPAPGQWEGGSLGLFHVARLSPRGGAGRPTRGLLGAHVGQRISSVPGSCGDRENTLTQRGTPFRVQLEREAVGPAVRNVWRNYRTFPVEASSRRPGPASQRRDNTLLSVLIAPCWIQEVLWIVQQAYCH